MSQSYIYTMQDVAKIVPPRRELFKKISLSFYYGAKIGIVGQNGTGKSSILRIMAGEDTEILGEAIPQKGIKIGYLQQEPHLDPNKTVREIVEEGIHEIKSLLNRFQAISTRFMEPMTDDEMNALLQEQGELQSKIDACRGWELDRMLDIAAEALRLPPWDAKVSTLSGGERRRVALCRLILSNPDLLLLDEPTNHLDAESVAWLERYLKEFPGTVIIVTHDRYFLDNISKWVLELYQGHGYPFEGNYSAWLKQKEERLTQDAKQDSALQKAIKSELDWVNTQAKGRHAKSKARINNFEEMNSRNFQKQQEAAAIYIPPGPRLGDLVLEMSNVSKGFDGKLLIDNFSMRMPKGAIVGIIGANGAGKSTFFKLLTGQEQPDAGQIRFGETVKLSYVDQLRNQIDENISVWEAVSGGLDILTVGTYEIPSRAYIGRFNFKGTDQQKLVKHLSGGEKNRLYLASLLQTGGNVLLLDEPTNDLDIETLRALEEALISFPGCVMVISHDRWFLDRIATHILAFEGDSKVTWFDGNYSEYEADRKERLGDYALQPHKIKYKKLEMLSEK